MNSTPSALPVRSLRHWVVAAIFSTACFSSPRVLAGPGTPHSYTISENMKCMGKGEDECETRFPSVTGNGGEGPVKVGGTPTRNPFNPNACPPRPTTSKVAAYSSIGWDPSNLANADKYNLKKLGGINGWPGEFHLDVDENLKAWRDSVIMRATKAHAKTLEADNSDIPGYSLEKMAAQLNHECDLHSAMGEPCPLKNNFEILPYLKKTPTAWYIETGEGNDGVKHIQMAKTSKVAPENIFIVHYGPPSDEVCNIIPGSHVVFSVRNLNSAQSNPCPSAPKGTPPPMPTPAEPSAPQVCEKNEPPPPDRKNNNGPPPDSSQNYSDNSQPPASYPSPAGNAGGGNGSPAKPSSPPLAASRPLPRALAGKSVNPDSTVTGHGFQLSDEARTVGIKGGFRNPASEITRSANQNIASGSAGPRGSAESLQRAGGSIAASAGAVGPGGTGGIGNEAPESGSKSPASKQAAANAQASEVLNTYNSGKALSDPKLALSGAEIDSAMKKLASDFKMAGTPEMPLEQGSVDGAADGRTLFEQVHAAHVRYLRGGRVTARSR